MSIILDKVEWTILNQLIANTLPLNMSFNLQRGNTITFNRLHELYGGEFRIYDTAKMYQKLSDYLAENQLATYIEGNNATKDLVLTKNGCYLVAHGNLEEYQKNIDQQHDEETIINNIPFLLSTVTPFGEFKTGIPPRLPNGFHSMDIEIQKKYYIAEHKSLILDERTWQYLNGHGFVNNRHDIQENGKLYRQLTDRGRKLQQLGSISRFRGWENQDILEARFRTKMLEYNYWIAVSIALSTGMAAVYYYFQLWDGKPQEHKAIALLSLGICAGIVLLLVLIRHPLKIWRNKKNKLE